MEAFVGSDICSDCIRPCFLGSICVNCTDPAVLSNMYYLQALDPIPTNQVLTNCADVPVRTAKSASARHAAQRCSWITVTSYHSLQRTIIETLAGTGCTGTYPDCDVVAGAISGCAAFNGSVPVQNAIAAQSSDITPAISVLAAVADPPTSAATVVDFQTTAAPVVDPPTTVNAGGNSSTRFLLQPNQVTVLHDGGDAH